ncbi:MAG: hypothetical protein AB1324_06130 [Candidatus Micrarchaeota archaeon]
MRFVLYEREKKGIARHLPAFKAAYDRLAERIGRRAQERAFRKMLESELREGRTDFAASSVRDDPSKAAVLGELMFHRNRNVALLACWSLRNSNDAKIDITAALPRLLRSLRHHDFYMRVNSANAILEASPTLSRDARMAVAFDLERFTAREMDAAVIADPGGAPMLFESLLALSRSLRALDGVHYLSEARLVRELKGRPKKDAACIGEQ